MQKLQSVSHRILIVLFLPAFSFLSCEKDKDEHNKPYVPAFNQDTNTVINPIDTLCPDGVFYDWNCYDDSVLSAWGMGSIEQKYVTNDRDYVWFTDQANTGSASKNNCGPSSAAMAVKWYDQKISATAEDARDMYPMDGDWWYTYNIIDYLDHHSIPNDVYAFTDQEQMVDILEDGNIMILCLTTALLRYNETDEERIDRFYSYADGHFLVVKGVRFVDANIYFETYDPNNWHAKYNDDSEKGKNRHYRAGDVSEAVSEWWEYIIVIFPDTEKFKSADNNYKKVDPSKIKHAWGN